MIKDIFGKNVQFVIQDKRVKKNLLEELKLYENAQTKKIDVEVIFVKKMIELKTQYISPSIHITVENGFFANYGTCKVLYLQEDTLKIYIEIPDTKWFIKFISVDFKTAVAAVGTILHELVLVPMTYFFNDLTLVHASSFKNISSGKTYMIGGTGGVGKTSIELLFCRKDNYSFISDDIAVVDADGNIYPNLSFPKIYAYNVSDNKEFEKVVLSNDSLMGKFQWNFIKKVRGSSRVRRRLSPLKLYKNIENSKTLIGDYIILSKNSIINEIKVEKIKFIDDVVENTFNVIDNEYYIFHNHIRWHEYNCLINNIEPIIKLEDIVKKSKNILNKCFSKTDNYYIKLPKNLGHKEFLETIEEYIK